VSGRVRSEPAIYGRSSRGLVLAVDPFGVDAHQDVDAVPGPLRPRSGPPPLKKHRGGLRHAISAPPTA